MKNMQALYLAGLLFLFVGAVMMTPQMISNLQKIKTEQPGDKILSIIDNDIVTVSINFNNELYVRNPEGEMELIGTVKITNPKFNQYAR